MPLCLQTAARGEAYPHAPVSSSLSAREFAGRNGTKAGIMTGATGETAEAGRADMHELSYAEQILKVVEHEARKHGARKVAVVRLVVGRMSGVDKGSLSFCLESIASGTMLDGAKIETEDREPEIVCASCGRFPVGRAQAPVCPTCGKTAELSPAADVYVQEIEVHDEADQTRKKD